MFVYYCSHGNGLITSILSSWGLMCVTSTGVRAQVKYDHWGDTLLSARLHLLRLCSVSSGKCSISSLCSLVCVNLPVLRESTFIQVHDVFDWWQIHKKAISSLGLFCVVPINCMRRPAVTPALQEHLGTLGNQYVWCLQLKYVWLISISKPSMRVMFILILWTLVKCVN